MSTFPQAALFASAAAITAVAPVACYSKETGLETSDDESGTGLPTDTASGTTGTGTTTGNGNTTATETGPTTSSTTSSGTTTTDVTSTSTGDPGSETSSGDNTDTETGELCPARVLAGEFTIASEEDLAALAGVTQIAGSLVISAVPTGFADTFHCLKSVTGNLRLLQLPAAIDERELAGLNQVQSIGGTLGVEESSGITNFDGFAGLREIGGDLFVVYDPDLIEVDGLANLKRVGGLIRFDNTKALESLEGLSGLESVGSNITLFANDALTNLGQWTELKQIPGSLFINALNSARNLSAFAHVTKIGQLTIRECNNLETLGPFTALSEVSEDVILYGNRWVKDLSGLSHLNTVGGDFSLARHDRLTNLEHLEGLRLLGDLKVSWNEGLDQCDAYRLRDSLTGFNGEVEIRKNLGNDDCPDLP